MATRAFVDSRIEMERILQQEAIGYLGLSMDGMPYVVPLNYAYLEGKIICHCALQGRKLDCIRTNPEVCFTVGRQAGRVRRHGDGDPCHVDSDSVICLGRGRIVEEVDERQHLLDAFSLAFRPDAEGITRALCRDRDRDPGDDGASGACARDDLLAAPVHVVTAS